MKRLPLPGLPALLLILALLLMLQARTARAQDHEVEWWNYQAQRGKQLSAVKLDMGLRRNFPLSGFPYVMVTRMGYTAGSADGLPAVAEQERLEALSDEIAAAIGKKIRSIYAGTTFSQGQQQSYFYVTDTTGLESIAAAIHARLCHGCKTGVSLQADPSWSLYREQLLPDGETRQRYGLRSY